MNGKSIVVVRIYLHETTSRLKELLAYLHDESQVQGVTVFRGITGFGGSGKFHSSTLLDLSLDLPLVIEFYDTPEKAAAIIEHLNTKIKPGHIVYWPAQTNLLS